MPPVLLCYSCLSLTWAPPDSFSSSALQRCSSSSSSARSRWLLSYSTCSSCSSTFRPSHWRTQRSNFVVFLTVAGLFKPNEVYLIQISSLKIKKKTRICLWCLTQICPCFIHIFFNSQRMNTNASYLSLNLWGLLLCLFELVPQGEDLPDASVPAGWCHGLPIEWNILLDGGIHQTTVLRLSHGHVALRHDIVWAALHLLPLCTFSCIFFLQWQVDAGAGRKE